MSKSLGEKILDTYTSHILKSKSIDDEEAMRAILVSSHILSALFISLCQKHRVSAEEMEYRWETLIDAMDETVEVMQLNFERGTLGLSSLNINNPKIW